MYIYNNSDGPNVFSIKRYNTIFLFLFYFLFYIIDLYNN
jgi:hypothetical protein